MQQTLIFDRQNDLEKMYNMNNVYVMYMNENRSF
jgi:hypothetical protein